MKRRESPRLLRLVLRRLLLAVPMSIGVATLVFALLEAAPGTPADVMLGNRPIPPEVREKIERAYGLDRPAPQRYAAWLSSIFLRADLGWSHAHHRPVSRVLARAIPPTLLLAGAALLIHVSAGVLIGVVSAARRRRWPDRLLTGASLTLYAMPTFWLGLMAILVFALAWRVFPAAGLYGVGVRTESVSHRFLDLMWHVVLPASVLGLASAATTARYVRAGVLEALGREFVRAARARGVNRRRVLWVHALRNALLPVVNLIGLSLPILLSGSLVIEVVFAWPGMGRLTYEAILQRDLAVVLACTLAASFAVIVGNLFSDVAMALVDPRVRLSARGTGP